MWDLHRKIDTPLVGEAMRELEDTTSPSPLPDPSFIWWKAQLLRRLEAERESTALIDMGERFHIGAVAIGALALAVGAWDYLPAFSLAPLFTLTTGFAAIGALVLLAVVALTTHDTRRTR